MFFVGRWPRVRTIRHPSGSMSCSPRPSTTKLSKFSPGAQLFHQTARFLLQFLFSNPIPPLSLSSAALSAAPCCPTSAIAPSSPLAPTPGRPLPGCSPAYSPCRPAPRTPRFHLDSSTPCGSVHLPPTIPNATLRLLLASGALRCAMAQLAAATHSTP
jgi:hypothetical protein